VDARSEAAEGSVDPALYALVHHGTPGDVDFYLRAVQDFDRILELGCGTGRILLPLAGAGHRVVGLDLDTGALALAGQRLAQAGAALRQRVRLVHGDMRAFRLDERFDCILIAFNTLYCLEDEAAQIACLRTARAHLAPGGILIWDAYAIDDFHDHSDPLADEDPDEAAQPALSVEWRGVTHDVYEATRWDRDAQRLEVSYRYVPRDGGAACGHTLHHRYLLTRDLHGLCARAGLTLLAAFAGFDERPLDATSEHMVCIAAACALDRNG
jgi:SAM-dependent methyltransferase